MNRTFDFTVITAVYNAEPFLPETVQSLLKQSIGFSRVQLILIDDGSTDGSPALCDAYAAAYPENVVVVHKENGGVSSARNEGLARVQGKYVSFLDADDMLSKHALRKVFQFFEAHPETDVVSLPMRFFDGAKGNHLLNFKYKEGTRVIDLEEEPYNPQLAVTSAFVRAEALQGKTFDTRLSYAEDGRLLQSILIEKRTLGVVADAVHHYRRRSRGEASAIQQSGNKEGWYFPYLMHFCRDTFDLCEARFGTIPRFIQYTVAYDLQWRVRQRRIPSALFDEAQKEEYRALFTSILRRIDDEILSDQFSLRPYQKAFMLYLKHGEPATVEPSEDGRLCRFGDGEPFELAFDGFNCDFFTVNDGVVTLECSALMDNGFDAAPPEIVAEANGVRYTSEPFDRNQPMLVMDLPAANRYGFVYRIPLPERNKPLRIRFFRLVDTAEVPIDRLYFNRFFPIVGYYRYSYAKIGNRVLTQRDGELRFVPMRGTRFFREVRFLCELLGRRRREERHAVLGRLVYAIAKPFCKKPIWLISDRIHAAGDNGEALFRYLTAQKPQDIRLYFAVSDKSPAFAELKTLGNVVNAQSYRHKMLFLLSDLNISSQADDDIITQFSRYDQPYRDIQSRIRFVFLQHGVTKDDLSEWLNRYNRNISGFVTVARPEADSIRTCPYFYPDDVIWLTGFPRFDRLYRNEQRCITIMPTWRHAWVAYADKETGIRYLRDGFTEGDFYCFFNALLNDQRLLDAAKETGYTIRFLPHPLLQPHMHLFDQNPDVQFLPSNVTYRDVFAESDLILTDYSSVVFDFAYLRKPVVYTQFDRETFFSGEHTYVRGYFDYDRDGFGEVETDYEKTVDRLIEYMRAGCVLKDEYRARIDRFFAFDDDQNCRRVFEKLRALQNR